MPEKWTQDCIEKCVLHVQTTHVQLQQCKANIPTTHYGRYGYTNIELALELYNAVRNIVT